MVNVVRNGFNLNFNTPFVNRDPEPNRPSALKNSHFVEQEIQKLLNQGAIQACKQENLTCISPLMVAEGKKLRLILDLSYLNTFLPKTQFKLEDLGSIIHLLPKQGFLTKFDFRSGYHHIKVHPQFQNYLGFRWHAQNGYMYFKFKVLPFGLSPAPWLFTKVFRPLVKHWRAQGIPITLYLDDGLIYSETLEESKIHTATVVANLKRAGVELALDKSILEPTQCLQFLGCQIDLKKFSISISQERLCRALEKLNRLLKLKAPTIHDRMRFLGSVVSMYLVVPDAILRSRATSSVIAEFQSANQNLTSRRAPSQGELEEWQVWAKRLKNPMKRSLPDADPNTGELFFYSDASGTGVGALLVGDGLSWKTSGRFSEGERGDSSTLRELKAVYFGLLSFETKIKDSPKRIVIHCDNQAAVAIMKKGSIKIHLQKLAQKINELRERSKAEFIFKWVPRENNQEADSLSREKDYGDWGVTDEIARVVMNRFGLCTVDLFVDNTTAKCGRFFSREHCPFSQGKDAFEHSRAWSNKEVVWCVPPPNLLAQVLTFLRRHRSRGILGLPKWKSLPIWPHLIDRQGGFRGFIHDSLEFGKGANILIPSRSGGSAFDSSTTKSAFLFLKFDFNSP